MKFKKTLLIGFILSESLLSNTLSDTTSLIEQIKTVSPEKRFELMNQIKSNILSLNQNDQAKAIRQMRESRQNAKQAKIDKIKAGLNPTELVAFEEKLRLKEERRKNYKARINNLRDGLSDDKKKSIKSAYRKKTKNFNKGNKIKRKPNKKITSKVYTTLTPEQLERFKDKPSYTKR